MPRTLALYSFPAALVALAWLRLETPPRGADVLWVVLLALGPALAPRLWLRLALAVPAALTAAWVALDTPAPDHRPGFFAPVGDRFGDGFLAYYDVRVPFSALEQPQMHGVLVLAVFGFCLALGLALAARRPLPAVLAVLAGAAWPATLYPARSVLLGALILAAALWIFAGMRRSRPLTALAAGAVLVAVAAGVSTSAAIAKDGVLAWERWDPHGALGAPVSVSYVWVANYAGIDFPKENTIVLRIRGPKRGLYWRATTLDRFDGDRWFENLTPLTTGIARGGLVADPLLPRRALNRRTTIRQDVEVGALKDVHLIGAAQPVRLVAPRFGGVVQYSGGVVTVGRGLRRGQEYTIWSYAPRPEPADLVALRANYPPALDRFFELGRTRVDPFGTPGRGAKIDALFRDERYLALWPYRGLWREARRLALGARAPYGAAVAIETWLRETGGFVYDQAPPRPAGLPPLAYFVDESRRGYCQHFAGAMALMLRFLGIPARVAAGFTSGKYENGGWTVTDHNAHTWVEVWFPGYGWLAFDPTPGRGSLAANYSASSSQFNAGDAANAFNRPGQNAGGAGELRRFLVKEQLADRARAGGDASDDGGVGTFWLLLAAPLAAAGAIGATKLARRRARYLTRDPRRLAGAARRELAEFLADQQLVVSASATPDELRELIRAELRLDGSFFTDALAEARFGRPAGSAAAAARARGELRALLRVIRRNLSLPERLRGLVALRSLWT
jgi:transglutaminase-like putative cysteine protease